MKNLVPVSKQLYYWDVIVNAKILKYRTPLRDIRHIIVERVQNYDKFSPGCNLEKISASLFEEPEISYLTGCYTKSKNLSKLKAEIVDAQEDALKAECQYCNIGEPSTFDHYLPQAIFPEYSAISVNLIPCCHRCNTEKGESWMKEDHRTIINYYYDILPIEKYLVCHIGYRNEVPKAKFEIDLDQIPAGMQNVINNHYSKLSLLERYEARSNSEIIEIFDAIVPHAGTFSRDRIRNYLLNEALQMRERKGHNYWRAVIRKALAESDEFLTRAGFPNDIR